jgi:hypothetical protein
MPKPKWEIQHYPCRGSKNCGWYTVPDNKEWHTVKWTITDDEFDNFWGYNFALNSDGNQYNSYFIKSVTLTKLDPSQSRPNPASTELKR